MNTEVPPEPTQEQNTPVLDELARTYFAKIELEKKNLEKQRIAFENSLGIAGSDSKFRIFRSKKFIYGVLTTGAIAGLIFFYGFLSDYLRPGRLLDTYNTALVSGDYTQAHAAITDYLDIVPDDWDLTTSHAKLLLQLGNYEEARKLYARLIAKSPLQSEPLVLFQSGLSYLPALANTRSKMNEVLADGTYIPALVARALLEDKIFRNAQRSIEQAIKELERVESGGELYKSYEEQVKLLLINLCRNTTFSEFVQPGFEHYPTNLRDNDLFVYGLDSRIPINFCFIVPLSYANYNNFQIDLEATLHAMKAFIEIRSNNLEAAISSIATSTNTNTNVLNSYIESVLLAFTGDFAAAETSLLRTDYSSQVPLLILHNLVLMLQGVEHWDKAKPMLDNALSVDPDSLQALNNRAVLAMIEERYGQALADLERAITKQKHYSSAIYNSAIALLETGKAQEAMDLFQTITNQTTLFPGVNYYFALANREVGNSENAINLFRSTSDLPGFGVLSNIALADSYATDFQGEQIAIDFYTKAFETDPNNFEAALKIALMTSKLGGHDQALQLIEAFEEQFSDISPRDESYYLETLNSIKGEIYHYQGVPEAEETLKLAVENSSDPEIYNRMVRLYTEELLSKNKVREALDITRTALPSNPEDINLLIARAEALAASNDIDAALGIIQQAEDTGSISVDVMFVKARVLGQDQRLVEAAEIYRSIYTIQPTDAAPLEEALALLNRSAGNDELKTELANLLERTDIKPDESLQVESQVAIQKLEGEQAEQVEKEISEITTLLDNDRVEMFSGLIYRGFLYSQLGDVESAIADYLAASEVTAEVDREGNPLPKYQPWQRLTEMYIITGNYEAAHDAITRAISYDPEDEVISNLTVTRAGVRERIGLIDEAIADYSTIIRDFPNFFLPYYRRCLLYIQQQLADEAIRDCTTAISIEPENIDAYRARHSAYGSIGDRNNAAKDANKITLLEAQRGR